MLVCMLTWDNGCFKVRMEWFEHVGMEFVNLGYGVLKLGGMDLQV